MAEVIFLISGCEPEKNMNFHKHSQLLLNLALFYCAFASLKFSLEVRILSINFFFFLYILFNE